MSFMDHTEVKFLWKVLLESDELISKRKILDIILFPFIGIQQNPQFNNIVQILLWWELHKHQSQDCYALILAIYHNFILSCVDCTGHCVDSWNLVRRMYLDMGRGSSWSWVDGSGPPIDSLQQWYFSDI